MNVDIPGRAQPPRLRVTREFSLRMTKNDMIFIYHYVKKLLDALSFTRCMPQHKIQSFTDIENLMNIMEKTKIDVTLFKGNNSWIQQVEQRKNHPTGGIQFGGKDDITETGINIDVRMKLQEKIQERMSRVDSDQLRSIERQRMTIHDMEISIENKILAITGKDIYAQVLKSKLHKQLFCLKYIIAHWADYSEQLKTLIVSCMVNTGFKFNDVITLFDVEIDNVFKKKLHELLSAVETCDLDCIQGDYSFEDFGNEIFFSFESIMKIFRGGIHEIKEQPGAKYNIMLIQYNLIQKCNIIEDYFAPLLADDYMLTKAASQGKRKTYFSHLMKQLLIEPIVQHFTHRLGPMKKDVRYIISRSMMFEYQRTGQDEDLKKLLNMLW